jgi:phosphate-selective porin OprO/OprP
VDYFDWGQLRIGQFKVPFTWERLQSIKYLDFIGRSAGPRNIARPGRDIGVMVHGRVKDDSIGYQVAVTNGTGPNTSDDNSAKDVSARFVFQPFRDAKDDIRSDMYMGISGTWGKMDRDLSDIAFSTVTGQPFVEFVNGTTGEGDRARLGTEFVWLMGPASIKGELMGVWLDDVRRGALKEDTSAYSWYVSGTYILTGEKKIRGKIVPDRPLSLSKRAWGAWELAARYSQFRTDSDLFRAGMATGTNKADILELGINWYINQFFRLSLNYEHAEFDDDFVVEGKSIDDEDAVLVQLQLEF